MMGADGGRLRLMQVGREGGSVWRPVDDDRGWWSLIEAHGRWWKLKEPDKRWRGLIKATCGWINRVEASGLARRFASGANLLGEHNS